MIFFRKKEFLHEGGSDKASKTCMGREGAMKTCTVKP